MLAPRKYVSSPTVTSAEPRKSVVGLCDPAVAVLFMQPIRAAMGQVGKLGGCPRSFSSGCWDILGSGEQRMDFTGKREKRARLG